jgi:alpha-galactosidase
MANGSEPVSLERSNEYGSQIVSALTGGDTVKIYGNVTNDGYIDNLPTQACVEVPCRVDAHGIEPLAVGRIPEHLAAINQTQVNVQRLAVTAALDSDPECAFQAMALDPLTGAVGTLDDIRAMTSELLAAHAEWLPAFGNRPLATKPRMADHA